VPTTCSSLILLPVGPGTNLEFLLDTLETVERFAAPDHKVLLADDSAEGVGARVQAVLPKVDVLLLRAPGSDMTRSVTGRFSETIAKAVRHSVENYAFKVMMRLDGDALLCNPEADVRGMEFLEAHPKVGMVGSYRVRCDGQPRDFSGSAEHLKNEVKRQWLPAKKALAASLTKLLEPALKNGYELGENIIAPGSMVSFEAAKQLAAHPLFGDPSLRPTHLGDDHLNSLMLRALGFELADFATGDLPLGVWLRKLEWSPEELVKRGKAVVHSVRGYGDLGEADVRERFRALRG
jgi:hypothetical protein